VVARAEKEQLTAAPEAGMDARGRRREGGNDGAGAGGEYAGIPDNLLVRDAKAGNHGAFGELVRRYQDRVYTIILGQLLSREDALDLTQEVFLKAHRRLVDFREDCVFYTWLYRIAVNSCIDFARRRRRQQEPFSLESEVLAEAGYEPVDERAGADPERSLVNKELGALLRNAVQALPEPLRLAVILHDVEGLPQKEIADIMGCPLGTVKSRIQRGRYELRDRLRGYLNG
jgi:RNA polymerase sigma-70 factor (ECF subfamily)